MEAVKEIIGDIEVSGDVLKEFRTGHQMHAAHALIRQEKINQSTAQLRNASRLMDGIGQLKYQIDGDLYFHMRAIHGPDCWRDPAFLKSAERDGLIRKVKGISNKIIIQRGPGKPSFPTAHLPLVGAAV